MNFKLELLQLLLLQTAHFKSVLNCVKGTVCLKMNILSSFTHPHAVPNLYEFLSAVEQDILKNVGNQTVDSSH